MVLCFDAQIKISSHAVQSVGGLSEFENWKRKFTPAPRYRNRELLWKSILPKFDSTEMLVLGFGIAHGYATNWWLRHNKARNIEWHGFDTFRGLPTSWTRGGRYPERGVV